MQEPLPGLEDVIAEFSGSDSWPGLIEQARQVAHDHGTFTVDDLTYTGENDQRIKGAALAYLRQIKVIEPLEMTRTIKPTSHGRPVVRWRLIEGGH